MNGCVPSPPQYILGYPPSDEIETSISSRFPREGCRPRAGRSTFWSHAAWMTSESARAQTESRIAIEMIRVLICSRQHTGPGALRARRVGARQPGPRAAAGGPRANAAHRSVASVGRWMAVQSHGERLHRPLRRRPASEGRVLDYSRRRLLASTVLKLSRRPTGHSVRHPSGRISWLKNTPDGGRIGAVPFAGAGVNVTSLRWIRMVISLSTAVPFSRRKI